MPLPLALCGWGARDRRAQFAASQPASLPAAAVGSERGREVSVLCHANAQTSRVRLCGGRVLPSLRTTSAVFAGRLPVRGRVQRYCCPVVGGLALTCAECGWGSSPVSCGCSARCAPSGAPPAVQGRKAVELRWLSVPERPYRAGCGPGAASRAHRRFRAAAQPAVRAPEHLPAAQGKKQVSS